MTKFSNPPNQSKGILDDFAVRKNVATREGTIEKVPVNDNDIVNKKYVDDNAGGASLSDETPQPLGTASAGTGTEASRDDHVHLNPMKQYSEANGDFNVTGTGWTTTRAVAIPYQTLDGAWRLKFNIVGETSGAASNDHTLTISGVVFKNVTNNYQPISASVHTVAPTTIGPNYQFAIPGTGQIRATWDNTNNNFGMSGDVELDSKPTWAD